MFESYSLNHDENVTLINEVDYWIDMLDVFDTTVKRNTALTEYRYFNGMATPAKSTKDSSIIYYI